MRRLLLLAATCACVLGFRPAAAGTIYTETFDTQDYADTIDPNMDWDTGAGHLTLEPWQLTQAGSITGMPGNTVDMEIRGDWLFAASQSAGVLVMKLDNPTSPSLYVLWSYGTVMGLDIEGDMAALATTNGTWLLDISNVAFPSVLYSKIGENVVDIEIVGNRVYLALNDSLRILDVTNPASPKQMGSVVVPGDAYGMEIVGNHAFMARGSNLSAVDISDPTSPAVVWMDTNNSSFVDVEVDGDYMYASIVDTGVRSYFIGDPENPATLQTYMPGNYVHGLSLQGEQLYVAWRGDGVFQLDVRDPANMVLVSSYDTPGFAEGLQVVGYWLYVADGDGVQVLRVGGNAVTGFRRYVADGDPRQVTLQGPFAYLAEGTGGLSIISLRPGDYGTRVGHLPLINALDVAVEGDYAYVANGGDGVAVVDVSNPASPFTAYIHPAGLLSTYKQVIVDGHLLYARYDDLAIGYVQIFDVTDPTSPVALGSIPATSMTGFTVEGGLAVFSSAGVLNVYDVTDPTSPSSVASIFGAPIVTATQIEGDILYISGGNRFFSYDISNPAAPTMIDSVSHAGTVRDMALEGNFAFVATDAHDFLRIDLTDPTNLAAGLNWAGGARGIALRGDEVWMACDDGRLEGWRTMNRRYAAATASATSINVNPLPDAVVAVRVTPADSPRWEYYVSTNQFSTSTNADSAQWEFLPAPGPDLRWFVEPYAFAPGTHPVLDAMTIDMLYEFGQIESVADVGNDQGKQVRLTWQRSGYDHVGSPEPIVQYDIYRQQVPGLATAAAREPAALAPQLAGWDYVASVPAATDEYYSAVVPTLADSTDVAGVVNSTFMVRAVTTTIGVHYDSYADSGYSVDNLAPMVPANAFAAYATGSGNQLSWDPSIDEDFQHFRIYRDADPGFVPGPGNLVDATTGNGWTDPTFDTGGVFYKISAVDFSGNESEYAAPSGPTVSVENVLPAKLEFYSSAPNPFRSSTTLRFALPAEAGVDVSIYDVTGRRVRSLASGTFEAGSHTIRWDGTDDAGHTLPPGLYLTRLASGREIRTGRIVRME